MAVHMTQALFIEALEIELERYSWWLDPERRKIARSTIVSTLSGGRQCAIDGPAWVAAWKACGGNGKPTYKALHSLPEE